MPHRFSELNQKCFEINVLAAMPQDCCQMAVFFDPTGGRWS